MDIIGKIPVRVEVYLLPGDKNFNTFMIEDFQLYDEERGLRLSDLSDKLSRKHLGLSQV